MLKGARSAFSNILPKLRVVRSEREEFDPNGRKLMREWSRLVESGFDERMTHDFASRIRAQDLPTEVFAALMNEGQRNAASFFFEFDAQKGDVLDSAKVQILLETPRLLFFSDRGGFERLDHPAQRAVRILTGVAGLEPRAIARLVFDRNSALTALALCSEVIRAHEVLSLAAAQGGGFRNADIKRFCADPHAYCSGDGMSLSDVDLLIIRTIAAHPRRAFEILFGSE